MKLTDKHVISTIRETWTKKLDSLLEGLGVAAYSKGDKQPAIAPELKVMHVKSGIRYTVDSISMRDVVLRTPEGETFAVDADELETNYKIA